MKIGTWLAAVAGIALACWLLWRTGIDQVLGVLARGGWAIGLVILFHLVQVAASAAAWRTISRRAGPTPGYLFHALLRWLREGVNNLIPSGQIGGEFVCARLLRRRGVPLVDATAGVIADVTMEMLTQIAFTVFGLALLVFEFRHAPPGTGPGVAVMRTLEGGVLLAFLAGAGLLAVQLFGGAHLLERALAGAAERFGWEGATQLGGLHATLTSLWRRPGRLAGAAFWHSVSWLLGGVEVWLALRILGHPAPLAAATVIESIGQLTKSAGFAVPGAIGIQEGGYVLVCGFFGIPADAAIALSLVKRLREILLGAPSLLVWHRIERWSALDARAEPDRLMKAAR